MFCQADFALLMSHIAAFMHAHCDQPPHTPLKKQLRCFGAVMFTCIESLLVGSMRPCRSPYKPKVAYEKFAGFWCGDISTYSMLTCRIDATMPITIQAKSGLRKIRGVLGR